MNENMYTKLNGLVNQPDIISTDRTDFKNVKVNKIAKVISDITTNDNESDEDMRMKMRGGHAV